MCLHPPPFLAEGAEGAVERLASHLKPREGEIKGPPCRAKN